MVTPSVPTGEGIADRTSCLEPAKLTALEHRVVRQRDALLALTQRHSDCEHLSAGLAQILEVAAATLAVQRVSIWRYTPQCDGIICLDLFDAASGRHSAGHGLFARDYPNYFEAIGKAEIIAANDAMQDPQTAEFAEPYLRPLGITSMLDAPIHLEGAVIGVLCHEHIGPMRRWTADEKGFAIGVTNLISLAFERCERSRAESTLMLQGAALNAASHAMVITDREAAIVWVNPAFTAMSGYSQEEAIGRRPGDLLQSSYGEAGLEQIKNTLTAGLVWRGEVTNRRKDGSTYLEDLTVTPVRNAPDGSVTHFVAIKRDLTQQRTLEGQFLQAQKMEVVGRLAGGIAHDFNNMLTVINGTAELALSELPGGHPLCDDLMRIQESGKRAASLTRQLLAFSRKQIVVRQPLFLAKLLTEFRGMLQRLIGEDIRLDVRADSGNAAAVADQSQIEQVILNLAVNARDAMPRGGSLRLEVRAIELDADFAALHTGVKPGPHVMLAVTDTGHGMTPEVLARIYEPFFTTKEAGKGTGLGLATVYAIVEQSGGTVWAESTVGVGTTFTIYLPRIDALEAGAVPEVERLASGDERILIVEDDMAVRELAERILRAAGYTVTAKSNSGDALQVLADASVVIDLIVTDVVMPGLGGRDLATRADILRPGVPVLFTSGYTDDTVLAHGVHDQTAHFLAKPYAPVALANRVREMLNAQQPLKGK